MTPKRSSQFYMHVHSSHYGYLRIGEMVAPERKNGGESKVDRKKNCTEPLRVMLDLDPNLGVQGSLPVAGDVRLMVCVKGRNTGVIDTCDVTVRQLTDEDAKMA